MIKIDPDVEQRLREQAASSGQEIGEYILWLMDRYESRKKQAAEEARLTAAQSFSEHSEK